MTCSNANWQQWEIPRRPKTGTCQKSAGEWHKLMLKAKEACGVLARIMGSNLIESVPVF